MSKHFSSGPWYIESGESSRVYLVNNPAGAVGEIVYADFRNPADAALVKEAPNLLETLRSTLPILDAYRRESGGDGDLTAANARAVIERATNCGNISGSGRQYYAVAGRIPGDDEDSVYFFNAATAAEAQAAFEEAIWEGESESDREGVEAEHGVTVFINAVLVSSAPILLA